MAREAAFMLLYEREMGSGAENTLKDLIAPEMEYRVTAEDAEFIAALLEGAWEIRGDLDALVGKYAVKWTADRIPKVELSILRLALYEMLRRADIPATVSMNEAVELAKKYAGEEAAGFVNGILGTASKAEEKGQ